MAVQPHVVSFGRFELTNVVQPDPRHIFSTTMQAQALTDACKTRVMKDDALLPVRRDISDSGYPWSFSLGKRHWKRSYIPALVERRRNQ